MTQDTNLENLTSPDSRAVALLLETAKSREYVPEGCYFSGRVVMYLVTCGDDPCTRCRLDRKICGGRPHQ